MTVVTARCCRDWPVVLGYPLRRCGYCGHVPEINWLDAMNAEGKQ